MIRSLVATIAEEIQIGRNLQQPALEEKLAEGSQLWMDFIDPTPEEINWLAQQLELNPAVVQDLQREDRRPALLVYPSYLFLSLFQPSLRLNKVEGKEIHCIITDNCFVTVRRADAETVDSAYDRVAQNPGVWRSGIAYFLYLTAQFVIDAYYPLLDRLSNQLNGMEENLLDKVKNPNREDIYRIKQQLITLREMVAPQREVISSVIGEHRFVEEIETRDLFRHLYERLLRVYDVIDSQRDLSTSILDMLQNQESGRLVEAVNRLTIFSMIFLPLSFFTGLFQLNFATTTNRIILPISGDVMFALVMIAMISSVVLMAYVFKKRGWL